MPSTAAVNERLDVAREFADSVAGVLGRLGGGAPAWAPGRVAGNADQTDVQAAEVAAALERLGWDALAQDPELIACAGLGAVQLGLALAPLALIDDLLGGSPVVGDLVRTLGPRRVAIDWLHDRPVRRAVLRCEPCASADGLDVHRILELGDGEPVDAEAWAVARRAWLAASVGQLAGVGQGALELTVDYVRQRRAFGTTLAGLAPVQQLLARAATAVRGAQLLAAQAPDADALAHAGEAIVAACAACQQVTGAIGFTLEYPLHRHTQRARALATWNEALLDRLR